MTKSPKITILGDGGWGTTLGILLAYKGFAVRIWGNFADNILSMQRLRMNRKFLPGVKIPDTVSLTHDLESAVCGNDLIVLAIPSQHLREVLKKIGELKFSRETIFVSAIKGIEIGTLKRMSELVYDELGDIALAVLSGPTIAQEVAHGVPTAAVIASKNKTIRKFLQNIFITERFRIYTNSDVIGVELGGSLKNVIAIACGISDGLGFGANTKAALLSRALVEISRLGAAMGAKPATFSGISGLGDLVTTCISPFSRNRFVGEQIGKGKSLKQIQSHMQMVAEGLPTAKSAFSLSRKYKIEMPITKEVYNVLYKNKAPLKAFTDLMSRGKKEE